MQNDTLETILCPVDFSDLSAYALRYAVEVAGCSQARVVALHTTWWEAPAYFTNAQVAKLQEELRAALGDAERSLRMFVDSALAAKGAAIETRIAEALPADGIRQVAAETRAGLTVMGTHGRHGWNRWTLGSVAERVLQESAIPVLTVRHAFERPIRQILCPVSDTVESRHALAMASILAACLDATVTALHVVEPHGTAAIPNLCSWVPSEQRSKCVIRELVRHGNAAEEIITLVSQEDYDLLVVGAARRRFFEGMVLGTTTLRAVRHASCPVLTVGPPLAPQVS